MLEEVNCKPVQIFCVYDRQDKTLRNALVKHLAPMEMAGHVKISDWNEVRVGTHVQDERKRLFKQADILLTLISQDFISSGLQWELEIPEALERHNLGRPRLIPVLLHPTNLEDTPLEGIKCLPGDGRVAVNQWKNRNEAFLEIARVIKQVVEELLEQGKKESGQDASSVAVPPVFSSASASQITSRRDLAAPLMTFQTMGLYGEEITVQVAPQQQVIASLPVQKVFPFNEPLRQVEEFFGRQIERTGLLNQSRTGVATSIVGPRKSGRTWLLQYLLLQAPQVLGPHYRAGYLDASLPSCKTVAMFVRSVFEALGIRVEAQRHSPDLLLLQEVVTLLRVHHIHPILCIDKIEGLHNPDEFHYTFFKELRALVNKGLCLVVVSRRDLRQTLEVDGRTSDFYNIFITYDLKPFNEKEATEFLQAKGEQAQLDGRVQKALLRYSRQETGGWYPIRLQLAGKTFLEDGERELSRSGNNYWLHFKERLDREYHIIQGPT